MEASVFAPVAAIIMVIKLEFIMPKELQIIGTQVTSLESQLTFLVENAHAKSHHAEKTIVNVLELEFHVELSANVQIAETASHTVMIHRWEDLVWK